VLASYFISSYMVYRGTTAGVGFAFFAQPLFDRVRMSDLRKWLDKNVPDWPRYLELRNSILKGVPTNAQLTLTLLRLGEANKSPLPPPPPPDAAPEATAREGLDMADDPNLPEEYREQLRAAAAEKQAKDAQAEQEEEEKEKEKTPKKRSRIMRLFKGECTAESVRKCNRLTLAFRCNRRCCRDGPRREPCQGDSRLRVGEAQGWRREARAGARRTRRWPLVLPRAASRQAWPAAHQHDGHDAVHLL
jgi:hypothetical protein